MIAFILSNWRAVLIVAISCAAMAFFGLWRHEVKTFEDFRVQVDSVGRMQNAKAALINSAQNATTQQVEAQYVQGSDAVRNLYGPGRVQSNPGGRKLPGISNPSQKPDAATADNRPDSDLSSSSENCSGLKSDAAVTTRQLLFFQDWIERIGNERRYSNQ